MDMRDIFRSFFGLGNQRRRDLSAQPEVPKNNFDVDGQCECDDENDIISQFPFFFEGGNDDSTSMDEMFRHFHGDMHRQMESLHRQMEDMMKGFGTITSENFPPIDGPRKFDKPDTAPGEGLGHNEAWFFGSPYESENNKSSPRDFMLKEKDSGEKSNVNPVLPGPLDDFNRFSFSFDFKNPFKSFPRESFQGSKEDTDLDGKVSNAEVMDLIKKSEKKPQPNQQIIPNEGFFSGTTFAVTTFTGPDGKVEQKKIVRDSSGREQSTVSRSVDGQSHTVTTVTGPDGLVERKEDFKNINQNDINKFEEKWNTLQRPQQPPLIVGPRPRLHPNDVDIFSKFFK